MEDVRGNRAEKSRGTQHPTRATPKNETSNAPKFPTMRTDSLENLHARFFFLAVREPSLLSAPNAPPSRRHFPLIVAPSSKSRLGVVQFRSSFRHREGEKNLRQTETIGSGLGRRRGTATGAAGRRLVRPVEPVDRAPGSVAGARVDPRSGSAIGARVADEGPRKKRPGALEGVSRR